MEILKTDKVEADKIIADVIEARVIIVKNTSGKQLALTYEMLEKLNKNSK